ncbi:hypothetical protein C4J81_04555 [Deltaproteobacteria bacterium Smac51]|nr:hypothetical protein C4J81_04555 [Deltaproteobacteria bacterium Smac51]
MCNEDSVTFNDVRGNHVTLVWTRIDQKLIHGQISLAWVPHLKIDAIVVADTEMKDNPKGQRFMKMGLPPEIKATFFVDPRFITETLEMNELSRRRVLLLFRDMEGLCAAVNSGLSLSKVNLGYHACTPLDPVVTRLGDAFYVCERDMAGLCELYTSGLEIILQTIPSDKAVRWVPAK